MSGSRAMRLALAGLCGASAAVGAVEVTSTGGSACQPTTPADAALVAYHDGAATTRAAADTTTPRSRGPRSPSR